LKYAILGDVHANFDALETVMEHAVREGVTEFTCVGDVVGYGPEPSRCIALLKEMDTKVVAGNHDWAVLNKLDVSDFNPIAKDSIFWTQENITDIDRTYLDALPLTYETEDFIITHGTLHDPERFFYLQSPHDAELSFVEMENIKHHLCVCGHSHVPVNFYYIEGDVSYDQEKTININPDISTIVNVGSVGQPRDRNNKTGYACYDSERKIMTLHRMEYNYQKTMKKIESAMLPEYNAMRLINGI
jgi:predicted phosphodiesterase